MTKQITWPALPPCPQPTKPAFHASATNHYPHFKTFLCNHWQSFWSGLTTNKLQTIKTSISHWSVSYQTLRNLSCCRTSSWNLLPLKLTAYSISDRYISSIWSHHPLTLTPSPSIYSYSILFTPHPFTPFTTILSYNAVTTEILHILFSWRIYLNPFLHRN